MCWLDIYSRDLFLQLELQVRHKAIRECCLNYLFGKRWVKSLCLNWKEEERLSWLRNKKKGRAAKGGKRSPREEKETFSWIELFKAHAKKRRLLWAFTIATFVWTLASANSATPRMQSSIVYKLNPSSQYRYLIYKYPNN